ncbi:hypothetical protein BJV78DRAFT_1204404 [Lactifluus subvellereus]|nr:hypothetical protein BJV78DRAFT_1204404 [Lactifluus subvellereus]
MRPHILPARRRPTPRKPLDPPSIQPRSVCAPDIPLSLCRRILSSLDRPTRSLDY